jgi:hypothetical protein
MLRVFFVLDTNWTCFEILCPKIIEPSQRVVRVFFDLGFCLTAFFPVYGTENKQEYP